MIGSHIVARSLPLANDERCLQSMLSGLVFGLFQRNFIQELGAFDFKVRLSLLFLPLRFGQFAWTICGCSTEHQPSLL